jgi:hypothetical protein
MGEVSKVTRISIAIDNRLYYQTDIETVSLQVIVGLVTMIAGKLWERAEWYTTDDGGTITR